MKLKEIHTPVFDFTITKTKGKAKHYCLTRKGKVIEEFKSDKEEIEPTVYLQANPEEFLDFDAAHYPDYIYFNLEFEHGPIHNVLCSLDVSKEKDTIQLGYFFSFNDKEELTMKLNPIRILNTFFTKAEKAGFTVRNFSKGGTENLFGDVIISVPAKGNLAKHYLKGLKTLEKIYDSVIREVENS